MIIGQITGSRKLERRWSTHGFSFRPIRSAANRASCSLIAKRGGIQTVVLGKKEVAVKVAMNRMGAVSANALHRLRTLELVQE